MTARVCEMCELTPLPAYSGRGPKFHFCRGCAVLRKRASNDKRRAAIRTILDKAKARPCADCCVQYPPVCMDFDHVRDTKEFTIGKIGWNFSLADLEAELAKCDVRCANCHRLRHYAPKGAEQEA